MLYSPRRRHLYHDFTQYAPCELERVRKKFHIIIIIIIIIIKFTQEQATKAQRWSRRIALLFL